MLNDLGKIEKERIVFKKYLILGLTVIVINFSFSASVFAETKEEKAAKLADKVKVNVAKLGIGENAKIEVKLKDGTKLRGYVSSITDDGFVVFDNGTNSATAIPYPKAQQVKGNNLSTGVKIAIGVGAVLLLFFILGLSQR